MRRKTVTSLSAWIALLFVVFLFFFFSSRRRHTRLTCDWSSDVCSSDLARHVRAEGLARVLQGPLGAGGRVAGRSRPDRIGRCVFGRLPDGQVPRAQRSEERRVGKGCRSGGAPER